jgi:hypothetical protein
MMIVMFFFRADLILDGGCVNLLICNAFKKKIGNLEDEVEDATKDEDFVGVEVLEVMNVIDTAEFSRIRPAAWACVQFV